MQGIWDLAEKKKKMMEDQKRVGGVMFAYSLEAAHHSRTSCTPFRKARCCCSIDHDKQHRAPDAFLQVEDQLTVPCRSNPHS